MVREDLFRPLDSVRGVVRWLVIASSVIFLLQQFWGGWLLHWFGLTPVLVLQEHHYWQVFTYQFLHGGVFHWLLNMFILWTIGGLLEHQWGTAYFVRFCLLTGVGAALVILLLAPQGTIPVIGLSATLFGLLVAFAMLYPHSVMYLYFVIPVKAWQAAALFAFIEFLAALKGRNAALTAIAHLSGMTLGYLYIRFGTRVDGGASRLVGRAKTLLPVIRWTKGVPLEEVTDDLVAEVDRILDKVSRKGAESLTPKEKEIMDRYTRRLQR